jgi:hypothetical protein
MASLNYYNFANNIISVGGRRLGVFATDGGVSYAPKSDILQSDLGADGIAHYSDLNDDRLEVTVTLMENSPSVTYLLSQMKLQRAIMKTGGVIPPLSFRHFDPSLGDLVQSDYTVFIAAPAVNKARTIGTREFKLELPYGLGNIKLAESIVNKVRGVLPPIFPFTNP